MDINNFSKFIKQDNFKYSYNDKIPPPPPPILEHRFDIPHSTHYSREKNFSDSVYGKLHDPYYFSSQAHSAGFSNTDSSMSTSQHGEHHFRSKQPPPSVNIKLDTHHSLAKPANQYISFNNKNVNNFYFGSSAEMHPKQQTQEVRYNANHGKPYYIQLQTQTELKNPSHYCFSASGQDAKLKLAANSDQGGLYDHHSHHSHIFQPHDVPPPPPAHYSDFEKCSAHARKDYSDAYRFASQDGAENSETQLQSILSHHMHNATTSHTHSSFFNVDTSHAHHSFEAPNRQFTPSQCYGKRDNVVLKKDQGAYFVGNGNNRGLQGRSEVGKMARKIRPGKRRPRKMFSDDEVNNLIRGVEQFGEGKWARILQYFRFEDRTAVDLKDKWRNLQKPSSTVKHPKNRRTRLPYSSTECSNLNSGVKVFGHNWVAILKAFSFNSERTPVDLKDKWRNLQIKSGKIDPPSKKPRRYLLLDTNVIYKNVYPRDAALKAAARGHKHIKLLQIGTPRIHVFSGERKPVHRFSGQDKSSVWKGKVLKLGMERANVSQLKKAKTAFAIQYGFESAHEIAPNVNIELNQVNLCDLEKQCVMKQIDQDNTSKKVNQNVTKREASEKSQGVSAESLFVKDAYFRDFSEDSDEIFFSEESNFLSNY